MPSRRAVHAGYLLLTAFLSLNPWVGPPEPVPGLPWDKLAHAACYAGLTVLTAWAWGDALRRRAVRAAAVWTVSAGFAMAFGGVMELSQGALTPARDGSWGDAAANAAGALSAAAFARFRRARGN